MAISTFAELQTAVSNWSDGAIPSAIIPDLIAIAESRFNKMIWTPQSETTAFATAAARMSLPSDCRALRAIYLDGPLKDALEQVSPYQLYTDYSRTGTPKVYALVDDQIALGPEPSDGGTVYINYYQRIPALSVSNTTNWLLTEFPDVYLYGVLVEGNAFIRDDEAIGLWNAALERAMTEMDMANNKRRYGAAPLAGRLPVPQISRFALT